MKEKIQAFQSLVAKGVIEDYFYSITLERAKIRLQGNLTRNLIRKFSDLGCDFQYDKTNEWFDGTFEHEGIDVNVTLTLSRLG